MAPRLITSLRGALQLAMEAPAARRAVVVDSVHVHHAAALLAFLRFEKFRRRWDLRNADRLASLVSLDGLLRALSTDLLPRLIADPASAPALLRLISIYARYVMASASAAGRTFARDATAVCEYVIETADHAIPLSLLLTAEQMRRHAEEMLRRLHDLRSRRVTISPYDDPVPEYPDSDSGSSDDDEAPHDLHITTLRQALQEITDAPAAHRRVFVDTVRGSDAFALLGVVEFQATACSWKARNLARLRAATTVAGCCETLRLGLLRVLLAEPNNRAALSILADFADYVQEKIGTVGGEYMDEATTVCISLAEHGATAKRPTLLMRRKAEQIRQQLALFMSRHLSVAVDSASDTISSSDQATSATETSEDTSDTETSEDTSVSYTSDD